jgi:ISXO2 transposase-like protein/transposase-like zinc ribbon protein
MERLGFPMSILEVQRRFADDAACLDYLAMSRWPEGFCRPGCGGRRAWVLARRHLWECAACGRQTSVTAGTIMDHTHLPLTLWFWPAYLMARHTPGISAVQLRQLGISRYETAWFILHKLRRAMIAPGRGLLAGEAEVDGAFVAGCSSGRRSGRDRTGKALAAVAVEVRGTGSGQIRLQALPKASGDTLPGFVQATIRPAAIVHTDGWRGYRYLKAATTTARSASTTGSRTAS